MRWSDEYPQLNKLPFHNEDLGNNPLPTMHEHDGDSRRGRPLWRSGARANKAKNPAGTIPTREVGESMRKSSRDPSQGPTQAPAVEIRRLKKNYGLKPILRGIDLTLPQGQRVALLGANGAGKTTVLRILAGLVRPDSGTVSVLGRDVVADAREMRHYVGFVAHQPYLYEELTALENLHFFARMYAVPQAHERAHELLQRLGLEKRMNDRVRSLSRGLVQRVAWARALLHRPHLLLLDEPDTGLDQTGTALIDALLAEHRALGGSVLVTTHLLDRALQQSDRVMLLGNGRVVYRGESATLTLPELRQVYQEVVG
jgi:heme exporter protein A